MNSFRVVEFNYSLFAKKPSYDICHMDCNHYNKMYKKSTTYYFYHIIEIIYYIIH